jgi:Mrp family chromosome partitioning ATPase
MEGSVGPPIQSRIHLTAVARDWTKMLVQTTQEQSGSAHVVVLGNEKGGSGKSTAALHIAVALMKAGQRVATIDLDCRQQSFTRQLPDAASALDGRHPGDADQ